MQPGVANIEQSIEVTAAPTRDKVEPDVQRCSHPPNHVQCVILKVSSLDTRHQRPMDADRVGQIDLAPASSMPDLSKCRTDTLIVHEPECLGAQSTWTYRGVRRARRDRSADDGYAVATPSTKKRGVAPTSTELKPAAARA
jgi:hypothetical protein